MLTDNSQGALWPGRPSILRMNLSVESEKRMSPYFPEAQRRIFSILNSMKLTRAHSIRYTNGWQLSYLLLDGTFSFSTFFLARVRVSLLYLLIFFLFFLLLRGRAYIQPTLSRIFTPLGQLQNPSILRPNHLI